MGEVVSGIGSLFSPKTPDDSKTEELLAEQERRAAEQEKDARRRAKETAASSGRGNRWALFYNKTGERGITTPGGSAATPASASGGPQPLKKTLA